VLSKILTKSHFWKQHTSVSLNPRQIKIINWLLDGFDGKLTSTKWAKICKCSQDTALRDINMLIELQILQKPRSSMKELKTWISMLEISSKNYLLH
jgi:Fic family protein